MSGLALTFALVALALSIVLLFGFARLWLIVQNLGQTPSRGRTGHAISRFATPDTKTAVLVSDDHCLACAERLAGLEALVLRRSIDRRVLVLKAHGDPPEHSLIEHVVDAELVGQLAISVTPLMILFDEEGREEMRAIAGNNQVLEQFLIGPRTSTSTSKELA